MQYQHPAGGTFQDAPKSLSLSSPARRHLTTGTILTGDARTRLADLPESSIDTLITSPPYYGLRDYGVPGQLGLESDVAGWVSELRMVMTSVARVLKPSGVVWLNLGDGYSRHAREGAPVKSSLLGPERLALSLVADGWILRNKVIWAKTNPMPSSVTDRLSTTYEVVYCFVRSRNYFFDLDAIRVPHTSALSHQHKHPWAEGRVYPPESAVATIHEIRRTHRNTGLGKLKVNGITGHPLGKNPGDVWHLATAGYKEAHFATFPVSLVERPLLASCPERVCEGCGRPWLRERAPGQSQHQGSSDSSPDALSSLTMLSERHDLSQQAEPGVPNTALGGLHPSCDCQAGYRPGVVLDPFMGAGTVAVAAEQHGRAWVGIELNPAYAAMAEARIVKERSKRQVAQERATSAAGRNPAGAGVKHQAQTMSVVQPVADTEEQASGIRRPAVMRGAEAVRPYDPRAA